MSRLSHPVGKYLPDNMPIILKMAELLEAEHYEELGLVCTGSSGAIIAAIMAAYITPVPQIFYIHKENEDHHSHMNKDDIRDCKTLCIVDDFVCSGTTLKRIITKLKFHYEINSVDALCLGDDWMPTELKNAYKENPYFKKLICANLDTVQTTEELGEILSI